MEREQTQENPQIIQCYLLRCRECEKEMLSLVTFLPKCLSCGSIEVYGEKKEYQLKLDIGELKSDLAAQEQQKEEQHKEEQHKEKQEEQHKEKQDTQEGRITPKIIGFAGAAGSGKDTAASFIEKRKESVSSLSFAKPLKDASKILFNFTYEQLYDPIKKEEVDSRWKKSPRQILQWLGTDALRNNIREDIFTINMGERIRESDSEYILITDVRFDNEANLIKSLGGSVVKIVRNSQHPFTTTTHTSHSTEKGISPELVDVTITNDGTLEEFYEKIADII